MIIGVPKEIKNHEYRVGLTPSSVRELICSGHSVFVQKDAGAAIGLSNEDYQHVGAQILPTAEEVFKKAEMIIKVKEPQLNECTMLRPGQIIFTYLHLAPDLRQTEALVASGCIAIAYETVTDTRGGLPLLAPMSEVAGRMSIQAGAHCLEKAQGGSGVLLGGVPGVPAARVVILGGGVVGTNAARMAMGLGADVTIIDKSIARLKELDQHFGASLHTIYATIDAIEEHVTTADLVVGAVLVHHAQLGLVFTIQSFVFANVHNAGGKVAGLAGYLSINVIAHAVGKVAHKPKVRFKAVPFKLLLGLGVVQAIIHFKLLAVNHFNGSHQHHIGVNAAPIVKQRAILEKLFRGL